MKLFFSSLLMLFAFFFLGIPALAKIAGLINVNFFWNNPKLEQTQDLYSGLPLPPTVEPLATATNSSQILVSGQSQKNYTVEVLLNNKTSFKKSADAKGNFSFLILPLTQGINTLSIQNYLKENQKSPPLKFQTEYKNLAPVLDINYPKDSEVISNTSSEIKIIGFTDSNENIISVNNRRVIVDVSGNFVTFLDLSSGENNLNFEAIDRFGNKAQKQVRVIFNLKN